MDKRFGTSTTAWVGVEQAGSFFRLNEGYLEVAPMLISGAMETNTDMHCFPEWDSIPTEWVEFDVKIAEALRDGKPTDAIPKP